MAQAPDALMALGHRKAEVATGRDGWDACGDRPIREKGVRMGDLSDKPTASAQDETDEIKVEDLEAPESDAETVVGGGVATGTGSGAGKISVEP